MVYKKETVPVDNEILLLRWCYRTTLEGSIDIEGCSFRKSWGIYDDTPNVIESTPIASKVIDIDLVVDRGGGRIVPWGRKILNDMALS